MTTWPHLDTAPITEALIDIRTSLPEGVDLATLKQFHDVVRKEYPTARPRREWFHEIRVSGTGPPEVTETSEKHSGYLFTSADKLQVVQARLDGFTFSRLKPYEDWAALRSEAQRLWDIYRSTIRPLEISRVAVRNINRIELPMPVGEIGDWLRTRPELASEASPQLSQFFMRILVPCPELNAHAILIQEAKPPRNDLFPVIFDIDVFVDLGGSPLPADSAKPWQLLEKLRSLKNRLFFESLTERTIDLFEPIAQKDR